VGVNPQLMVAVRAGTTAVTTLGWGYLVADRLVLTAASACGVSSDHRPDVVIALSSAPGEFSCRVAWTEPGVPPGSGAALLEVVDPKWPQWPVPTSRWGGFTGRGGSLTCHIAAMPPLASHSWPDVADALTGRIGPFGSGLADDLMVEISGPNDDGRPRARPAGGGSGGGGGGPADQVGAAVIHNGLIVGVVRAGGEEAGQRFLPVMPATRFVRDAAFGREIWAATRQIPRAESLELSGWLRPWPVGRPRTPADLLRPELGVVAFTGRGTDLDELAEWCRLPALFAARAVVGGPGAGKTRLGREIAARMNQDGWVAGFVGHANLRAGIDRLVSTSRPALLIVDDAEARTDVALLMGHIMARRHGPPVRCLLLIRDFVRWRNMLQESSPEIAAACTGRPLSLADLSASTAWRTQMAGSAARDLASGLQELPDYASTSWAVREAVAARSESLPNSGLDAAHQAILATLLEDDPEAGGRSAEVLLAHEERRWAWVAHECEVPVWDIRTAVAIAHCHRPANAVRADTALSCVPGLRGQEMEQGRRQVADWLGGDLASREVGAATWRPFLSSLLAGTLIARTMDHDLLTDMLGVLDLPEAAQALLILARASVPASAVAQDLRDALAAVVIENPRALGPAAAAAAALDPLDALIAPLAALVQRVDLEPVVISGITRAIPAVRGVLNDIAISAHQSTIERMRGPAADAGPPQPALAAELICLGRRLAATGATDLAIGATREAAGIYRDLSVNSPATFRPSWGAALLDLAGWLEPGAAVESASQAVKLHRELADVDPPRFLPELASSLLRLGSCAEDARETDAAERAQAESVRVYRGLCQAGSAVHRGALAAALELWTRSLDRTGQPDAAAAAAEELAAVYAELSEMYPASYLHLQAAALDQLSERRAARGEQEAALAASESAVHLHRLLAAGSPDLHLARLVDALGWLSDLLCATGLTQQARAAGAEAVTWCRASADAQDAVGRARLACALTTVAVPLGELGLWEGCRATLEEAVEAYRQLAADKPERHQAPLAAALTNLAAALGEGDHPAESLVAAQEAVEAYRQLAADDPERYQPALAAALTNLAVTLGDDGSQAEALAAAEEAVSRLRGLPAGLRCEREQAAAQLALAYRLAGHGRYMPAVAAAAEAIRLHQAQAAADGVITSPAFGAALRCLADLRHATGQYQDALKVATRAVEFYRRLETERHGRYSQGLPEALGTLARCQASLQLWAAAQDTAEEAVEFCRRLAGTDPARGEAPLASALAGLAARCDQSDKPRLADVACAEAMERFQRLTGRQAEKRAHEYLMVQCDHARRLGAAGREEGMGIAHEAIRRARERRAAGGRKYVPLEHAEALTTLVECLRWKSRRTESHVIARQVAESCGYDVESLVADSGDDQWTGLADHARTISQRLYALGYLRESLDIVQLAVRGYRAAADAGLTPSVARYGIARSLSLRSAALAQVPRRQAAAQAADQAIDIYRELAADDPAQFLLPLASALDDLADCHRRSQAAMLRAEARSIRSASGG